MSFRELRNFCEIMRSLGYHRLISMENFRTPNFELVADILDWLLHRFEPHSTIPDDISTESRRVEFVKAVVEKVVIKTGTKLNAKKLYGADGFAVKELLKLATQLYEAQRSVGDGTIKDAADDRFTLSSKLSELKDARSLCSQIVETGAGLFDLLQKEGEVRDDREKALKFLDGMSRNLGSNSETEVVERAVAQLLGANGSNLEQLKTMSEELQRDEKSLEQKIRKKRVELDRCRKRLSNLAAVRPAFMDEYEQLEGELERYYEQYVGRFRNLDFLEHEVDELNREEKERMEANERALKRLQKHWRDEEARLLRGEEEDKGRPKKAHQGRKTWMPPSNVQREEMDDDDDDGSSEASGSDSNHVLSVRDSDDSGVIERECEGAGSIGGSVSDGDILPDSEDDEDMSDDDGIPGLDAPMHGHRQIGNNFDF